MTNDNLVELHFVTSKVLLYIDSVEDKKKEKVVKKIVKFLEEQSIPEEEQELKLALMFYQHFYDEVYK